MTSLEYLKHHILELSVLFPSGKFSYEYDELSEMHLIQVRPLELYDLDNNYKDVETKISIEFDNLYFPESVLFLSDNSLNHVYNPEFEICGLFYGLQPEIINISATNFLSLDQKVFESGENNYALAA